MGRSVGLVVVHGIGEQTRGATARKLTTALREAAGTAVEVRDSDDGAVVVDVAGSPHTVHVYEAFWADLLAGERGAFTKEMLPAAGLLPRLNRRHGMYPASVRPLTVRRWTVALWVMTALLWFALYGLQLLTAFFVEPWRQRRRRAETGARWSFRKTLAERQEHYSWIDEILDGVVGDIFRYVDAARPGLPPGSPVDEILDRFRGAVRRALIQDEVQVLAHSLGTVVAYHGLTGYRTAEEALTTEELSSITRIWTIGSPLDKIAFIWPRLTGIAVPAGLRARWTNYSSVSDAVSGRLDAFPEWDVDNRTVPAGGLATSHVVYERSGGFLGDISEGLFEVRAPAPQRRLRRLRAFAEWLAVPAVVVVATLVGLTFLAFAAGVGWLLTQLIGVVAGDTVVDWLLPWVPLGMAAVVFIVIAVTSPLLGAANAHRTWRGEDPPQSDSADT